ncbi:hypothetical protein [Actinoplanes sp. NPDC048796]|uniref:hypothetical protein n=1 Tax=Actinoplanes sp. NPDC048796 TaxID=3155640 RepID=UPI0033EFCD91
MNDIELLRTYGPDAPPISPAARTAARARLHEEMTRPGPSGRARRKWPLVGAAGLGLAAAATVVVAVLTAPATPPPPTSVAASTPPATRAAPKAIKLVASSGPSFPWTLPGLGKARFTADPGRPVIAVYPADDGSDVYVSSTEAEPGSMVSGRRETTVDGRPARITVMTAGATTVSLDWEHRPGQWVRITGVNRYGSEQVVRDLAARLLDKPQPVDLRYTVGLVPDGWQLSGFKENGAIVTYVNPDDPGQSLSVSPIKGIESDLSEQVDGFVSATTVTVHGNRVPLVRAKEFWLVQVPLPDGSAVRLMTTLQFTSAQVVAVADSVRKK